MSIPIPDAMFDEPKVEDGAYANGGIVAFDGGGEVKHYRGGTTSDDLYATANDPTITPFERDAARAHAAQMAEAEAAGKTMAGVGESVSNFFGGIGNYFTKPQGDAPPPNAPVKVPPVAARFAPDINSRTLGASPADLAAMNTVAAPPPAAPTAASTPKAPAPRGAGLGSLAAANKPPAGTGTGATGASTAPPTAPSLDADIQTMLDKIGTPKGAGIDAWKNNLADSANRIAKEKQEDFWGTIAQIGFGMAGSSSPYALQALGQSASAALPGMMEATKARRAEALQAMKDQAALDLENFGFNRDAIKEGVSLYGEKLKDATAQAKITSDREQAREDNLFAELRNNATIAGRLKEAGIQAAATRSATLPPLEYMLADALTANGIPRAEALTRAIQTRSGETNETRQQAIMKDINSKADAAATAATSMGGANFSEYKKLQRTNPAGAQALYDRLFNSSRNVLLTGLNSGSAGNGGSVTVPWPK